ncbi:MAG: hypothetical protein H7346_08925 [Burkholderiaceae bacterium]|nr:hypothetical protein [Burkholderiaceae bacterium]
MAGDIAKGFSPYAGILQEPAYVAGGPAFPLQIKLLASVLVGCLLFWGIRAAPSISLAQWPASTTTVVGLMSLFIALSYYWILRSRTSIDATTIRQTWFWNKEVKLADVTQAKFIYVPYFTWLVVPRLVVRSSGRGMYVFHSADKRVLAAFARLSLGPTLQSLA